MKKWLTLICLFLTSGLALAADDGSSVVTSANSKWNETFNRGDIETLASFYTEDATLSPGNGAILTGREAIQNLFKSFVDNGVKNHQIEMISVYQQENQIVQLGNWRAEGVNADGAEISFGGVLMTVLEQNADGQWQLRSHIWNMAN